MLKSTSHPLGRGEVYAMLGVCDECKDVLDADQDGASGPFSMSGALLAPFRANGAHPS